ncbi:MAG TPA: TlpA disulfide reductase family protein [Candidatus Margulisiibacteriota bacterium]|nr:TlpA disulfide reductase family protein [Candidatus Margulisiibacteriota bacterium]
MKRYLFSALLVLSLSHLTPACAQAPQKTQARLEKIFPMAPDFTLQDIYQEDFSLKSYREKSQPVLLFFWTTWCPYCQQELRVLNSREATLEQDGLTVMAINVGEDPAKVETFIKTFNPTYRVLLDKDTEVSRSFGIMGVPTYVLIDKEGHIVFQDNFFPLKEYKDLITVVSK